MISNLNLVHALSPRALLNWWRRLDRWHQGLVLGSVVVFGYFFYSLGYRELLPQWTLRAANKPKGTYEGVITNMAERIGFYDQELGFRMRLISISSEGSTETLQQLRDGLVDIGIVQGDTDMARTHGGAVLTLYDEVFLLVTKLPATNLTSLASECRNKGHPLKIACLGRGSQSFLDLQILLDFHDIATNDFRLIQADYPTSARNLLDGDVDAAFFITAISSPIVRQLCRSPGVRVLPLSEFGMITNRFRGVSAYSLSPGEFGAGTPAQAVSTLSTPAVLMAANQVQRRAVTRLARVLYSHRWELEKRLPFLRIQPLPEAFESLLHPGAEIAFGAGSEGLVKRYSEHFKLLLGLPAAIGALWGLWKNLGRKPEDPPRADPNRDNGAL